MNILVLGGNGYLGSKVIETLVKEGQHSITTTVRPASSLSRIVSYIEKDLQVIPASIDAVESVMKYKSCDVVLNMVCSYGNKGTLYNNVLEANINFPLRVLDCAAEKGCSNYLTIGTGLPDDFNMYSYSKKIFSEFGNYYSIHQGINFFNLKLQMFYGSDEPCNRFIPQIIDKMLSGQDVNTTIGIQHRDIISVSDIIDAIMAIMHSELLGYQEIPVGTGIAPTISELIDFIWQETGRRSNVYKGAIPLRKNEPDCVADVAKISQIMTGRPIHWQTGIRRMIQAMKGCNNETSY